MALFPKPKRRFRMNDFYRIGNEFTSRTAEEIDSSEHTLSFALEGMPKFGMRWDVHLPVFLTPVSLARIFWLDAVYQKAIDVPGQIVEFGSQWGASLNTFLLLKMIREPWNIGRIINSFSTFSDGFVSINEKDGNAVRMNDSAVSQGWEERLRAILESHAARSPIGASNNFKVISGDATVTFPEWLNLNPGALISHAHFDMDVYEPTREILKLCLPRMPKGAVLIFDELNCSAFPGETRAVQEVLGIKNLALRKSQFQPYSAYCIVE
jgi:hypothetical protein